MALILLFRPQRYRPPLAASAAAAAVVVVFVSVTVSVSLMIIRSQPLAPLLCCLLSHARRQSASAVTSLRCQTRGSTVLPRVAPVYVRCGCGVGFVVVEWTVEACAAGAWEPGKQMRRPDVLSRNWIAYASIAIEQPALHCDDVHGCINLLGL